MLWKGLFVHVIISFVSCQQISTYLIFFWLLWRNSPFLLHLHQTNPLNSQQRRSCSLLTLRSEVCAKKRKFERTDVSPKTVGSFASDKGYFFIVTTTLLSSIPNIFGAYRASAL